ncbi:IclR family transcriptional regulator [Streptomyces sp. BH097]|uniref:IclR family transcriptional regulator n=1 Tax=unclassified Streptomyces TaxID=2593676 RepID=UPI003BB5A00C
MLETALEAGAPLSLLEKAEKVLAAFDGGRGRLSLTEIIHRSGLSRSSAHRILDQLVKLRWLDREGRDYRLGLRMLEHGGLAAHHNRLIRAAIPHLDALHEATGKLVQLYVLDGVTDVVCLERAGSLPQSVGDTTDRAYPVRIGARLPAHATAAGKAMLAFGDKDDIETVVAAGLRPRTHRTVTRPDVFCSELSRVRTAQIAYDRGETFSGLVCSAVPLRGAGRAVAAVSLGSLGGLRPLELAAPLLHGAARAIWRDLNGPGRAARHAPAPDVTPRDAAVDRTIPNLLGWVRSDSWM